MSRLTAAALLAKQRDSATVAANKWHQACVARDRVIEQQRLENENLRRELETSLRFDQLHSKVQQRCRRLFVDQHYDEAVAAAMKVVEVDIRTRTFERDEGLTAVQLLGKVMKPASPQIVFSSHSGFQEAVHLLFRGAFGVFRNPVNHEFLDIRDPAVALEILAFASRLLHLLDGAQFNQDNDI